MKTLSKSDNFSEIKKLYFKRNDINHKENIAVYNYYCWN